MKLLFYLTIYGHFSEDLADFCGILGLSCSINGGILRREALAQTVHAEEPSELAPVPA